MTITPCSDKFTAQDIADLRTELQQSGLDSWQAAELVSSFLSTRGYGISSDGARKAVARMDPAICNLAGMKAELERLALFV